MTTTRNPIWGLDELQDVSTHFRTLNGAAATLQIVADRVKFVDGEALEYLYTSLNGQLRDLERAVEDMAIKLRAKPNATVKAGPGPHRLNGAPVPNRKEVAELLCDLAQRAFEIGDMLGKRGLPDRLNQAKLNHLDQLLKPVEQLVSDELQQVVSA
jgi:hypothetical protein